MMNMWMLEMYVCLLPLYVDGLCILYDGMHPCMHYVKFLISAFNPCSCSWGCLLVCFGVHRVLFAGLRDGDVTVSNC